jgi:antirestriction protein ArdC
MRSMIYAANAHSIRHATNGDALALRDLAELDSRDELTGAILVAEAGGAIAAALSLDDGRVVADPFRPTDQIVAQLRVRAEGQRAFARTPSLRERIRAAYAH